MTWPEYAAIAVVALWVLWLWLTGPSQDSTDLVEEMRAREAEVRARRAEWEKKREGKSIAEERNERAN